MLLYQSSLGQPGIGTTTSFTVSEFRSKCCNSDTLPSAAADLGGFSPHGPRNPTKTTPPHLCQNNNKVQQRGMAELSLISQVPEMAEGGRYPDPLEAPISEKMAPGPVNTKVHGTRPEADLLDVDTERTMKGKGDL